MPIIKRRQYLPFPVIGKIKKGKVVSKQKNGKEVSYPVELPYFRMVFLPGEAASAVDFINEYKPLDDEPLSLESAIKQLNFKPPQAGQEVDVGEFDRALIDWLNNQMPHVRDILFFVHSNEIENFWSESYEAYAAGRLVAKAGLHYSDEVMHYEWLTNPATGEMLVRNWKSIENGEPVIFDPDPEVPVGKNRNGKDIFAKPMGRLNMVVDCLQRYALMTLTTSSMDDIGNIAAQLETLKSLNGGVISGIPLIARRRPIQKTVRPKGKNPFVRDFHMVSIEASAGWTTKKIAAVHQAALPAAIPGTEHEPGTEPVTARHVPASEMVINLQSLQDTGQDFVEVEETQEVEIDAEIAEKRTNMPLDQALMFVIGEQTLNDMQAKEIENAIKQMRSGLEAGEIESGKRNVVLARLAACYTVLESLDEAK